MVSTLLVIGGVLVGLLVLLVVIVRLSGRPEPARRTSAPARSWAVDAGAAPDAWTPLPTGTSEIPAVR